MDFVWILYGSQDKYLEIKKFINNNIDIIESELTPMNDYFGYCLYYYYHKKSYMYFSSE